jgi:hypothetical protein
VSEDDRVGFTLRSTFTGRPSQTTVLGVQQGSGSHGDSNGVLGPLADTGSASR